MRDISLKKIVSVAKMEYMQWLFDTRMILFLILLVFINEFAVNPLLEHAVKMNEPLNIFEPFIAITNSGALVLTLPLVFITLMADFPRMDGSIYFWLPRMGKVNWFLGELCFSILSIVTFMVGVFIGSILMMGGRFFAYNGWSLVATDYVFRYPESKGSFTVSLLPENLYNQMAPFQSTLLSAALMCLYLFLLLCILLLFAVLRHKIVGFVLCTGLIAIGTACCALRTQLMWIFPMAHSITWLHFSEYFRMSKIPISWSVIYFIGGNVFIIVAGFVALRKTKAFY